LALSQPYFTTLSIFSKKIPVWSHRIEIILL